MASAAPAPKRAAAARRAPASKRAPAAASRPAAAARGSEAAARVLRRFRTVFNAVKSHFRTVEKAAGIAGAQAWALAVVRDDPGIGVMALARAMDVHQSTASNLLKPLIAAELVVATRLESDRRAVGLRITAKGARVLRKVPGPFEGLLPDALGKLDAAVLARLEADLDAVIRLLPATARRGNIPLGQPQEPQQPAPRQTRRSSGQRGLTSKA
jgi:DNA-binding MarR family transcriptional regulator